MKKKTIPKFSSEDKEREFWASNDASEFIDFSQANQALFPNLLINQMFSKSEIEKIKLLAMKSGL